MGKFVDPKKAELVQEMMFGDFDRSSPREKFLQNELARYVPQLAGKSQEEIANFVMYQRDVYLNGVTPTIGVPVASLNPSFVDGVETIGMTVPRCTVYSRASLKENGYRFQLHNGSATPVGYTRQFTPYDLRLFPELKETIKRLPVMIGDAELINAKHPHLAGFHRVEMRIPAQSGYWPKAGTHRIDDELLKKHFENQELFQWGIPIPDMLLTLSFHGIFAIADPKTWEMSKEIQMKHLISFCKLPVDYEALDKILDQLSLHIKKHNLNARIVERKVVTNTVELQEYVTTKEKEGHEGVCVVQTVRDEHGHRVTIGPSSKIKRYETFDTILMGLYLTNMREGLEIENIEGAIVGLYDEALGLYLPVTKVNLDPTGVQIKTQGQRERLTGLRQEIVKLVSKKKLVIGHVTNLYETFLLQGMKKLTYLSPKLAAMSEYIGQMMEEIPRGKDLVALFQEFQDRSVEFLTPKGKCKNKSDEFLRKYSAIFEILNGLEKTVQNRFLRYFSETKEVKKTSAKLIQADMLVDTENDPIILETHVFGIKWGKSPYPAGFHSWYMNSFMFNNNFAERIRPDKDTTTSYETVFAFARKNTIRKRKLAKKRR